ncbi:MAG: hypothetical protein EBY15_13275, partial [Gammaproteobacteria bacterium]|nr:hypothetical protein [Gammaproteobacteria bacterium]
SNDVDPFIANARLLYRSLVAKEIQESQDAQVEGMGVVCETEVSTTKSLSPLAAGREGWTIGAV